MKGNKGMSTPAKKGSLGGGTMGNKSVQGSYPHNIPSDSSMIGKGSGKAGGKNM